MPSKKTPPQIITGPTACGTCHGTGAVSPYWDRLNECTSETCPDCHGSRIELRRRDAPAEAPERVNHPSHYRADTGHEAIDVIEAWQLGFCLGNTVKYIARAGKKDAEYLEELKKARWYLDREIKRLENAK